MQTSEMVERVARALYECEKRRADHSDKVMGLEGSTMEPWDECKETFQADARAALEAMREPTPSMVSRMEENVLIQYEECSWEEAKDVAEELKVEWLWMRGVDEALRQ